jgi:sulfite reductase (ferredoxin)
MLGGGLGSQPLNYSQNLFRQTKLFQLQLRIFDRYGERAKRLKAYEILIKDIGRDEFMRLVDEEKAALSYHIIDTTDFDVAIPETLLEVPKVTIEDTAAFETWKNQMS